MTLPLLLMPPPIFLEAVKINIIFTYIEPSDPIIIETKSR